MILLYEQTRLNLATLIQFINLKQKFNSLHFYGPSNVAKWPKVPLHYTQVMWLLSCKQYLCEQQQVGLIMDLREKGHIWSPFCYVSTFYCESMRLCRLSTTSYELCQLQARLCEICQDLSVLNQYSYLGVGWIWGNKDIFFRTHNYTARTCPPTFYFMKFLFKCLFKGIWHVPGNYWSSIDISKDKKSYASGTDLVFALV